VAIISSLVVGLGRIARVPRAAGRILIEAIFIFLLLIISLPLVSQTPPQRPNHVDAKNLRQGGWIILFDARWNETTNLQDAAYYRLISYQNDLPVGKVSDRYWNGSIQWEGTLLKDRPDVYEGAQTWYYETGEKKSEAVFKNNEVASDPLSYLRNGQPANLNWQADYYHPAVEASESEDYKAAARLFEEALPHVEAIMERESEEYADVIFWLSLMHHDLGNRTKVLHYEQQLASIYKLIREPGDKDLLTAIFDIARSYRFLKQWDLAEEWLKEYFQRERKYYSGFHQYHGLALCGLGDVYSEQFHYQKSVETLEEAKSYYEKNPPEDKDELQLLSSLLSASYSLSGKFSDGEKLFLEELQRAQMQDGKTSVKYANALASLGNFCKMGGQLRKAESYFKQAVAIMEKASSSDKLVLISSCVPLIEVYFQLGQPQFADVYIRKSQTILDAMDKSDPGYTQFHFGFLVRLADYYEAIGNTREQESTLSKMISFSQASFGITSTEYLTSIKSNTEYLHKRSQWAKADVLLKEASSLMEGFRGVELNAIQIRLFAKLYQQRGLTCFMLDNFKRGTYLKEADHYLEQSMHMYDRLQEQEFIPERIDVFLTKAGINELRGDQVAADKLYEQCASQIERDFSKDHPYYTTILFAIAIKAEGRNNIETSNAYYSRALQKLNAYIASVFPYLSIREKEMFYQANANWISNFQSFAVAHSTEKPALADELYNLQLSNKGIVLQSVNRVRQLIIEKGDRQTKALYEQWRDKKNDLVKSIQKSKQNADETTRLTDEVNALEKKLAEQSNDFANWSKQASLTWKDVQKQLKDTDAAVEIMYVKREIEGDSIYAALIVRKESIHPEVVIISEAGVLENKQLKFYRNAVKLQQDDPMSYNAFWKPIAEKLRGISKVYISSDGAYHQVNIATLYHSETNQYVFDEMDVHYVPSTAQLAFKMDSRKQSGKGVLVAHPDYGSKKKTKTPVDLNRSLDFENIADLPGTETERVALSALFRQNGISFSDWSEADATEENIKSIDNPSVLHIATHGFFLTDITTTDSENSFLGFSEQSLEINPLLRSGLLLAGCQNQSWKADAAQDQQQEDGILTAFEASALKLDQTELVVLSACETGLGEIKNGEGVYGLQRAFAMAGARQIIMSLWKVDDQATQEFMIAFYEQWLKTHDSASAFKAAQIKLKSIYPAPYYWGAFVLTGN